MRVQLLSPSLSLPLAMVAAVAVLLAVGTSKSFAAGDSVLAVPVSAVNCLNHCDHCDAPNNHWTHNGGSEGGLMHFDCMPGGCGIHTCGSFYGEGEEASRPGLAETWRAFAAAAPNEVPALLQRYAGVLEFDADAQAIYLVDCEGAVFAHVPLSDAQITALTE